MIENTQAQTISADRKVDWSTAGLRAKYTPSKRYNVKEFGAKGDGFSDDSNAILGLLKKLRKGGGEVYFPKGTYLLKQTLLLPSGTVITGDGSDQTHLLFDSGSKNLNCIVASGDKPRVFQALKNAPKKGDQVLMLQEVDADIKVGDYLELRQENGSWDKKPRDWARYCVGQIVKVTKLNGKQIHIDRPIRIDYDFNLKPELGIMKPAQNVGIQNLSVERFNKPSKGNNFNIQFRYAVNCWVKGVEGKKSAGSHLIIAFSSNIEVSGCYFHHAFDYSGSGTRGYGVTLISHSGECLIENNIFSHLRHAMMVKQGANGNVFAYNYSFKPTRKELISNYSGDISMHGHYPFANLFEGNVVQNIMVDKYWGESGPDNTLFRNRVKLYGIIYSPTAGNGHNVIANEVTSKALFMGNLLLPGRNHLAKGNAIGQKSAENISEKSLFYKSYPHFWDNSIAFPTIGNPATYNKGEIPAEKRTNEKRWTVFYQ
ncbi:MAG: glycosyl hydrolase family 28-related protein [Flammeovirgaceae bacterium]